MSAPISIGPSSPSSNPNPKPQSPSATQSQLGHGHHPSTSSTSSNSTSSPQTPFSPSFSLSPLPPPNITTTGTSPNPKSPLLQWASTSFGSLGKSPTSPPIHPPINAHEHDNEHEHESHDAFEFGDISDMSRSSWTGHSRRAASMSNPSGVAASGAGALGMSPSKAGGAGGISAMLSGFGATGGGIGPGSLPSSSTGVPVGSPPSVAGGVLSENAAKGQGLLRRLSLGGAGRGRPVIPPPTLPHSQTTIPAPAQPAPAAVDAGKLSPDSERVGFAQRGRRYSENPGAAGKKRGVSPMGERLLRDHGHF